MRKVLGFIAKLFLWSLTIFFVVSVVVYMPHLCAFIALAIVLLLIPIRKWQDLIEKLINKKIKVIIFVVLFILIIQTISSVASTTRDRKNRLLGNIPC